MKTTMVMFTDKEKIEYQETDIPEIKENEVLIKTNKTMISTGTELAVFAGRHTNMLLGRKGAWGTFPFKSGYINAGTIIKAGSAVKDIKEGDRVLSDGCNSVYVKCSGITGAQYSAVKIPDNVQDEEALFVTIANIVFPGIRQSTICTGDNAVVVGLGLLGQLALQFLKLNGAYPAIGVDLSDFRLEVAKKIGAETLINSSKVDMLEEVKKLTEGRGADVAIELTGAPKMFASVCALARPAGKVILLSSPHGAVELDLYTTIHGRCITVIGLGALGANIPVVEEPFNRWTVNYAKAHILKLIGAKKLKVNELISHRYNWKQAHEAYAMLAKDRGSAMGVILDWSK